MKLLAFLIFGLILYFVLDTLTRKTRYKKYRKWLIPIVFLFMLTLAVIGAVYFALGGDAHCGKTQKSVTIAPAKVETANEYFEMGDYQYDLGNCTQAIENYDTAINMDPNFAQALNNRGYTYMRLRDYNKALKDLDKAIELRPDYVQALMNRGDIYNYYFNIDRARAIEDYDKVLVLVKDNNQRKNLAVCGHKLLAKNGGWSPLIYIELIKNDLTNTGCD